MVFQSILFQGIEDGRPGETIEAPDFSIDLGLDQMIDAITSGKQEYNLKSFFYTPLHDADAIQYRHEVFQDLENAILFEKLSLFARHMRLMREHLAQADKLRYKYQKGRWFLDAVEIYCDAVVRLVADLSWLDLHSRGLLAFRYYVTNYAQTDNFTSLMAETKALLAELSDVKYALIIKGNSIGVRKYEGETDYSAEIEETFEKFKQGAVKDYHATFTNWPDMNHVEAQVLDFVAALYPDTFSHLADFCVRNSGYLDEIIRVFDREIHFYIAYMEYEAVFKQNGLSFCYPHVSDQSKEVYGYDIFDLALTYNLVSRNSPVICNDFWMRGKERIFVVTGPNQGGKTTFARTFGQLHYMGCLGCPVPGRQARLFLFDRLFTHFEKEEDITTLRGKLEDDLVRIHTILEQATTNSIIIMNEIFTSTTLQDAIFLGKKVLEEITQLDALCVCVTFIDELATLSAKTVSLVSTVVPENPTLRTYKIVRRPANGLAYALAIAEKYHLTYKDLKERLKA